MEMIPSPPSLTSPGPSRVAPVVVTPRATRLEPKLRVERLAVTESVLEGDGKSLIHQTFPELFRDLVLSATL